MYTFRADNRPLFAPASGRCSHCGRPWGIDPSLDVAYEMFYVNSPVTSRQPVAKATELIRSTFMGGIGTVASCTVMNPAHPDSGYNQTLADHDIWEENEVAIKRDISGNDPLLENDALTVNIVIFLHPECDDQMKYFLDTSIGDTEFKYYIRGMPWEGRFNSTLYHVFSECHQRPYFNPPGYFDHVEEIIFDESYQTQIFKLFSRVVGTEVVEIKGTATVNYLSDYLQVGAPWNDDEAVAGNREEYSRKMWVECRLNFKAGFLIKLDIVKK